MSIDEETVSRQTPVVSPGNYSPVTVTMNDTLGVLFVGILAGISLIGWMNAEARYRALLQQRETTNGNNSLDTR